jgi:hypothetical protein
MSSIDQTTARTELGQIDGRWDIDGFAGCGFALIDAECTSRKEKAEAGKQFRR